MTERNCFTCRFRYKALAPDNNGGRPWRCAAKGGYRLAWGQDKECPQGLWEPIKQREVSREILENSIVELFTAGQAALTDKERALYVDACEMWQKCIQEACE